MCIMSVNGLSLLSSCCMFSTAYPKNTACSINNENMTYTEMSKAFSVVSAKFNGKNTIESHNVNCKANSKSRSDTSKPIILNIKANSDPPKIAYTIVLIYL